MKFDTKSLHAGYDPEKEHNSLAVPIYQTVAHLFDDTEHAARLFNQEEEGHVYGRITNPTVDVFERRMAELEEGDAGLATSSGMSAIFILADYLAGSGGEIVSSNRVYGGTFHLFTDTLPRLGIKTHFVENPHTIVEWERTITPQTTFLFLETPTNPTVDILEIAGIGPFLHRKCRSSLWRTT